MFSCEEKQKRLTGNNWIVSETPCSPFKEVLFAVILDCPVLQTFLGSNIQYSCPFLGGGLLLHLRCIYQGQPGIHMKEPVSWALTLSCIQHGLREPFTHLWVFRNYDKASGRCLQYIFQLQREIWVFFAVVCKLLWKRRVIMFLFQELSRMLGFEANHSAPLISRNQDANLSK